MNEYIIGIDIGTSKVCASAGKIDKNKQLQITAVSEYESFKMKKGMIVDIDDVSDKVKKCIEQLEDMIDTTIKYVYVSIPGESCELIFNKATIAISSDNHEIKRSDADRIIKTIKSITLSSEKEVIGLIPKQYIIDGYDNIKDPVGMFGNMLEMEAQIVTVQTTIINNLYKCINKIGLKVKGIVYLPEAVARVALKVDELHTGTAVVDTGKDSINISIYKGSAILTNYTIPIGGNTITNDLSICLKIPFEEAEKLKKDYSDLAIENIALDAKIKAKSSYDSCIVFDKVIFNEIIEARTDEIIRIIEKSIIDLGYYNDISGIVLLGGGICLLNGIEDYSKIKFRKPVRIGFVNYSGKDNTRFIGSIGIVNYVYNNMKLYYLDDDEKDLLKGNKIWNFLQDKDDDFENESDFEDEQKEGSIITKIKDFFADFF